MYVARQNQEVIQRSFDSPFITALLGPRRVGKTTLVQNYAEQRKEIKWIFLNMDLRAERLRVEKGELATMIEEQARQKIHKASPLWVAIDEAQKCAPLFEQIKVLYDRFKGTPAIKFILTGSGFLTLHELAAETLAGRIELHHLHEFGLREAAELREGSPIPRTSTLDLIGNGKASDVADLIAALSPHRPPLQRSLSDLLAWGGLPEVLQTPLEEGPERRIAYLGNYLQTYLEKDVRDIVTVTDLSLFQKMMEVLALQTGSVREDKRLIDALSCSRDTLKKYRGYLEATLVYLELYPYIGSPLKRLVKSPKGYLTNNGLISYLTGIYDAAIMEKTGVIGHRFENWALREIQLWLDRDPRRSQIHFWRTSGHVEVDLVVVKHPLVLPCEAAYSTRIDSSKRKHLQQFLAEEKNAPLGIYLYNGDFNYDAKSRILSLPAWTIG